MPKTEYSKKSWRLPENFTIKRAFRNIIGILILLLIYFVRFKTFDVLPENHLVRHISSNQKVVLTGIIVLPPEKFTDKNRLYLESETLVSNDKTIKVSGKVRITVYETKLPFRYGDRIKIHNI